MIIIENVTKIDSFWGVYELPSFRLFFKNHNAAMKNIKPLIYLLFKNQIS